MANQTFNWSQVYKDVNGTVYNPLDYDVFILSFNYLSCIIDLTANFYLGSWVHWSLRVNYPATRFYSALHRLAFSSYFKWTSFLSSTTRIPMKTLAASTSQSTVCRTLRFFTTFSYRLSIVLQYVCCCCPMCWLHLYFTTGSVEFWFDIRNWPWPEVDEFF